MNLKFEIYLSNNKLRTNLQKHEAFFMHLKNTQYKMCIISNKVKKKKNGFILKCRKLHILP